MCLPEAESLSEDNSKANVECECLSSWCRVHVGCVQRKIRRWRKWIHLAVVHNEFGLATMCMKMFNKFPHETFVLLLL